MSHKTIPATLENIKNFVDRKNHELEDLVYSHSPSHITQLKREYSSILERYEEGNILTESDLEFFVNDQLDRLREEQQAERINKKLSKKTTNLYSKLRRFYSDARSEFGIKRVRNLY